MNEFNRPGHYRNDFGRRKIYLSFMIAFLVFIGAFALFSGSLAQPICTSPYVVKQGDRLSSIARQCDISLQALIAANPGISNTSQLYPGEGLTIPNMPTPASKVMIPNTGSQTVIKPQMALDPDHGVSGTRVVVAGTGFTAGVKIQIGQGPSGATPVESKIVLSGNQGNFISQFTIPQTAELHQPWVFTATPLVNGETSISKIFTVKAVNQPMQQVYIVQYGDTLSEIAARFDTSIQALMQANPQIRNPNLIYTEERLVIPGERDP